MQGFSQIRSSQIQEHLCQPEKGELLYLESALVMSENFENTQVHILVLLLNYNQPREQEMKINVSYAHQKEKPHNQCTVH